MRWLTFAACAAIGLVLQTTIAGRAAIFNIRPDWMFVLVVFFALYGRRPDVYLAGWILGMATDMMSIERLGLLAVGYTLTAVTVSAARDLVFLKSAVTHFAVTLTAGLFLHAGLTAYRIVVFADSAAGWGVILLDGTATALYTAVWAVPMHHVLLKLSGRLGLHTSRYSHKRLVVLGSSRV